MSREEKLVQLKQLQHICENHEQIRIKLNWDMLRLREENSCEDFFYYEDDTLIGFLGVYNFGEKYEICGVVHPNKRGQGIFTKVLQDALATIPKTKTILLNAPESSQSGKAFLEKYSCDYSFTEYQMVWENKQIDSFPYIVELKESKPDDLQLLSTLDVACFGYTEEEAMEFNQRILSEQNRITYLIGADKKTVGKISVQREGTESWIYGFAVFPEHQGKGYGKNTLMQIIESERKINNDIHLEVDSENEEAKKLYVNCGFVSYDSQDYYIIGQSR